MAAPIAQVGAVMMCPHGAPINVVSANFRVLVGGSPAAIATDPCLVAGCAFTVPPAIPQPCVTVQWLKTSLRVRVGGNPVVCSDSAGLCLGVAPAGPPVIVSTQQRVKAT